MFARPRAARSSKATANTLCQKCLQRGHYSFECKASLQDRPYAARPTRSQQVNNPKLVPKLNTDVPEDLLPKKGIADGVLKKKEEERGRARSRSSSHDSIATVSTNRSRSPSVVKDRHQSHARRGDSRAVAKRKLPSDSEDSRSPREPARNTRRRRSSFSPDERGRRRTRSRSVHRRRSASPSSRSRSRSPRSSIRRRDSYSSDEYVRRTPRSQNRTSYTFSRHSPSARSMRSIPRRSPPKSPRDRNRRRSRRPSPRIDVVQSVEAYQPRGRSPSRRSNNRPAPRYSSSRSLYKGSDRMHTSSDDGRRNGRPPVKDMLSQSPAPYRASRNRSTDRVSKRYDRSPDRRGGPVRNRRNQSPDDRRGGPVRNRYDRSPHSRRGEPPHNRSDARHGDERSHPRNRVDDGPNKANDPPPKAVERRSLSPWSKRAAMSNQK